MDYMAYAYFHMLNGCNGNLTQMANKLGTNRDLVRKWKDIFSRSCLNALAGEHMLLYFAAHLDEYDRVYQDFNSGVAVGSKPDNVCFNKILLKEFEDDYRKIKDDYNRYEYHHLIMKKADDLKRCIERTMCVHIRTEASCSGCMIWEKEKRCPCMETLDLAKRIVQMHREYCL